MAQAAGGERHEEGTAPMSTERDALADEIESPEFKRGFIVGVGIACSTIQSAHDQPTAISEALLACNLDHRELKAAGLDDYDLEILRPVFKELRK